MRGSVFRIISNILDREFESIETSSGFAQLLGENWGFQRMSDFFLSNYEVNVVISRKKI